MAKKEKAKSKPAKASAAGGRVRKLTKKQTKQKTKAEARARPKMLGSFRLVREVFVIWRRHWKVLGGITLVYVLLNLTLASGFSTISSTIDGLREEVAISGEGSSLSEAARSFDLLVGNISLSGAASGSIFLPALIVIESLVIIWALRQLIAGSVVKVKEAYYSATSPLVPFLLVSLVVLLQLLPIILGTLILGLLLNAVIISEAVMTLIGLVVFALLSLWSLYMLSSSIFGLYIITLPSMQPRQALRSAKNLVRLRRWQLMRRLLFLPFFIFLAMAILVIPLALLSPPLAAVFFYLLLSLSLLFVHTYLYSLYRSLL